MRKFAQSAAGAVSLKLVIAGFAGLLLAGCSDSIERFSSNYNNPSDSDPVYTASIPKIRHKYAAPTYRAPQQVADAGDSASNAIVQSPIASAPLAKPPVYDYTKSYAKTYKQPKFAATAPVLEQPKLAAAAPLYVRPQYKAPVIQNEQDTEVIADNTSDAPAAKVKNLAVKKQIFAQIPVKKAIAPVQDETADASADAPAPIAKMANQYTVAKGDTLFSLGRKYSVSPFAIAEANGLSKNKSLPLGKTITIPAKAVVATTEKLPKTAAATVKTDVAQANTKKGALALPNDQPTEKVAVVEAAPTKAAAPASATPSDAQLSMRWPARGKIISGFGSKPNGMKNEGLNIAMPEGTNVQAAEGGVVAYAGNELKGYGNLVLVRHPGGYVTAYAHTSQILVKKGDTVKRGDVIAKSGSTGAVQSPQLHFEVRKGATALDPTTFLNSNSASN